jgi:predicted transglutaminase-like cysteine proteinase
MTPELWAQVRRANDEVNRAIRRRSDQAAYGVARQAGGEAHAVLLLNTTQGEYVLDNLTPWIVPWDEAPYQWRWREVGGDPLRWAAVASRDAKLVQVASRQ